MMFPKPMVYGLIGLLLLAVLPLPIAYYGILRVFVTVSFVLFAVMVHKRGDKDLVWQFVVVAVIFNPLMPFYLGKELWVLVDLGAAAYLWSKVSYLTEPKPAAQAEEDAYGDGY